jgi:hypothetical protein
MAAKREEAFVPLTDGQKTVSAASDLEVVGWVETVSVLWLDGRGKIGRVDSAHKDVANEISHLGRAQLESALWPETDLWSFLQGPETVSQFHAALTSVVDEGIGKIGV